MGYGFLGTLSDLARAGAARSVFAASLRQHTGKRGINAIGRPLMRRVRRLAVGVLADPLVSYCYGPGSLLLPLSHELPFYQAAFPQYGMNVARIARAVSHKYQQLSFIDVGANVGDTVAFVHSLVHVPTLAVEGDPTYFAILQKNAHIFDDVYLERAYLGGESGSTSGIAVSAGGTGRVVLDAQSCVLTATLDSVLARYPMFAGAKLIKIDTDGMDFDILQGSHDFLVRAKPLVFFEHDPFFSRSDQRGFGVFAYLRGLGYSRALIYENTGDYLLTAHLDEDSLLEDIHEYYSNREGRRYCDVCAVHKEDVDLARELRAMELEFFRQLRGGDALEPEVPQQVHGPA
jgi:FkbM family methyltransferase